MITYPIAINIAIYNGTEAEHTEFLSLHRTEEIPFVPETGMRLDFPTTGNTWHGEYETFGYEIANVTWHCGDQRFYCSVTEELGADALESGESILDFDWPGWGRPFYSNYSGGKIQIYENCTLESIRKDAISITGQHEAAETTQGRETLTGGQNDE